MLSDVTQKSSMCNKTIIEILQIWFLRKKKVCQHCMQLRQFWQVQKDLCWLWSRSSSRVTVATTATTTIPQSISNNNSDNNIVCRWQWWTIATATTIMPHRNGNNNNDNNMVCQQWQQAIATATTTCHRATATATMTKALFTNDNGKELQQQL